MSKGNLFAGSPLAVVVGMLVCMLVAAPCVAGDLSAPDKASMPAAQIATEQVRFWFVPDDPYFHADTPSAGWAGQWHLVNEHVAGLDASVAGAWARDITGAGVIIGIVDDCVEAAHPDLAPNFNAANSWDFGQNDGDPSPVDLSDKHGISVAGVAAAAGGNGTGVTGVAPEASIAGLRIDFPNQTRQMFIDATLYNSSGANTSIKVKNHSYGYTSPYVYTQNERAALATSAAAGTIHVFAAGNEFGTSAQDTNKMQTQNSPDCITVAAMGSDGTAAYYSNFGACVFVTAPSSGSSGLLRVTTTDRTGSAGYNTGSGDTFPDTSYTSLFGGTSSASPLVAGIMALGKQVQPALDVRFAKHLLARTSRVVDPTDNSLQSDGGWRTNAAGFTFNQNYGFGLVDADAFTAEAVKYTGVTPLITESTGMTAVGVVIPDEDATGVTRTFSMSESVSLEEVLVSLNITHGYRGDLEAYLTSPSGYTSRLMVRSTSDNLDSIYWTYTTNAFWGEDPLGLWSLNVRDIFANDVGTWNSYSVTTYMGTLVPEPATLCLLLMGSVTLIRRRRR